VLPVLHLDLALEDRPVLDHREDPVDYFAPVLPRDHGRQEQRYNRRCR
jgi:hypothetical protein